MFGCASSDSDSKNEEQEVNLYESLPADLELNPYAYAGEELNPENLRTAVIEWNKSWEEPRVKLIAWLWGGIGNNNIYRTFTYPENPGLVAIQSDLPEQEMEKIAEFAGAEFMIISGNVAQNGQNILLTNTEVEGDYDINLAQTGVSIDPSSLEGPYYSFDVYNSIDAWKEVEVTVTGVTQMALEGNNIKFKGKDGYEILIATTAEKYSQDNLKDQIITVSGLVHSYDAEENILYLKNCSWSAK